MDGLVKVLALDVPQGEVDSANRAGDNSGGSLVGRTDFPGGVAPDSLNVEGIAAGYERAQFADD